MRYLAALDYDHLDNGMFLSAFAKSLSKQSANEIQAVIVHGESVYTERIMQTGVFREEATIRSIKGLNHRLVALFADEGISTVGINPYNREVITKQEETLTLDHSFIDSLPKQSVLLISTLVQDTSTGKTVPVDLSRMLEFLIDELKPESSFIFSKSDKAEVFISEVSQEKTRRNEMSDSFRKKHIPDDLLNLNHPVYLTTARDFNQIPDKQHAVLL